MVSRVCIIIFRMFEIELLCHAFCSFYIIFLSLFCSFFLLCFPSFNCIYSISCPPIISSSTSLFSLFCPYSFLAPIPHITFLLIFIPVSFPLVNPTDFKHFITFYTKVLILLVVDNHYVL